MYPLARCEIRKAFANYGIAARAEKLVEQLLG